MPKPVHMLVNVFLTRSGRKGPIPCDEPRWSEQNHESQHHESKLPRDEHGHRHARCESSDCTTRLVAQMPRERARWGRPCLHRCATQGAGDSNQGKGGTETRARETERSPSKIRTRGGQTQKKCSGNGKGRTEPYCSQGKAFRGATGATRSPAGDCWRRGCWKRACTAAVTACALLVVWVSCAGEQHSWSIRDPAGAGGGASASSWGSVLPVLPYGPTATAKRSDSTGQRTRRERESAYRFDPFGETPVPRRQPAADTMDLTGAQAQMLPPIDERKLSVIDHARRGQEWMEENSSPQDMFSYCHPSRDEIKLQGNSFLHSNTRQMRARCDSGSICGLCGVFDCVSGSPCVLSCFTSILCPCLSP